MKKKILLGLTTIAKGQWKEKIKEIDQLGIKEIALFPTCLDLKERKALYLLLKKTGLKSIPHVHLREQDMEKWELNWLVKKYKTKVFNVHPVKGALKLIKNNKVYRNKIFVENLKLPDKMFRKVLKNCGGICLDLTHWQDYKVRQQPRVDQFKKLFDKNKIGCNHVSAFNKINRHSTHYFKNLKEFDYLRNDLEYFSNIISLELENSFKEQLVVKRFLEKIIF